MARMRADRLRRLARIALLALIVPSLALAQRGGAPRTFVVAPGSAMATVGGAVSAARAGDRIVVRAGVYREPTIVVDKRLTIEGSGDATLDGEGKRQILTIVADDVTIRGLRFRDVGTSYVEDRSAIRVVKVRGCDIEHNVVENGFFGIYLAAAWDCRIVGNEIHSHAVDETSAGNGIHLWSSHDILVADNHVSGHRDGIYFEFVRNSVIRGNVSERNLRYGLHFMYSDDDRYVGNTFRHNLAGVAVMYTHRVQMIGNTFADNWGAASYGLLFKEIYDSRVEGNHFLRNTVGLFADGANRLVASHNEFVGNGWAVKLMSSTEDGRFTDNDFVANTFDVATNGGVASTTFDHNYWDEYRGYDLDRDGRGDVPHHPVRLFSMIVDQNAPSVVLLRSPFISLLDAAERVLPSLTPETLADHHPAMRRIP